MTRFSTWLGNTWNTLKNVGSKVGAFIGKAAPIVRTVDNAMSYLPGKIGTIGKAINHYGGMIDSFTGLLPDSPLKNKLRQYTGYTGNINQAYTGNVNQAYLQQQNPMKYGVLNTS
jgi:hypothetical protein